MPVEIRGRGPKRCAAVGCAEVDLTALVGEDKVREVAEAAEAFKAQRDRDLDAPSEYARL